MYQVLFAEDELLVRLGLQNSIPWEKYNMKLVAQADNGIEAFEKFLQIRPDVVITDIRMEGMDGFELIQKIRENDEQCAIIVISCLDDFETLRKLIPYKIKGYILKASMSMEEIFVILKETEEYLREIGRTGKNKKDVQKKTIEEWIVEYLHGDTDGIWGNEEKQIQVIVQFYLEETEQDKINELAMKFIYELVNRQIQSRRLIESGKKEFCLLIEHIPQDLEECIDRINRSIEGFLGVHFCVDWECKEENETLRELYERLQKRKKIGKLEEKQWDKLIQKAVCYMREHHQDTLSLSDISSVLNISPGYFSRLFKKETGKNYVEFLNEIRLEEVLKELQESDYKISFIAEKHGFHNQEYFSRFFKKSMGISPAKWRLEHR